MKTQDLNIKSYLSTKSQVSILDKPPQAKNDSFLGILKAKTNIVFGFSTAWCTITLAAFILVVINLISTDFVNLIINYFSLGKVNDIFLYLTTNKFIQFFTFLSITNMLIQILTILLWRKKAKNILTATWRKSVTLFFELLGVSIKGFFKGLSGVIKGATISFAIAVFGLKLLIIGVIITIPISIIVGGIIAIPSAIFALGALSIIPITAFLLIVGFILVGAYPLVLATYIKEKRGK